ncbi:MAG: hypothetical protein AB1585_10810, partial [Thermodesulfobacteriota bacterium]
MSSSYRQALRAIKPCFASATVGLPGPWVCWGRAKNLKRRSGMTHSNQPIVKITSGRLQGTVEDQVLVFR